MAAAHDGAVILCADDYAISEGVSRAIEELAAAGRLSAASALVTLPTWRAHGPRLAALRPRIAIGLHVNLTLGAPLGPMSGLAPSGSLPPLRNLLMRGLAGRLDTAEIAAEISRQIDRFETATGHAPDFIDGHEHVHVLAGVRDGLIRAVTSRFAAERPLIRDPADRVAAIIARGGPFWKALALSALAAGFGARVRGAGFPTNRGFAGVSAFDTTVSFARELERFFRHPGSCHIVMCHPGYADTELARLDPVVGRREQELEALMNAPGLDKVIWHVRRSSEDRMPIWPAAVAAA
jgi:predicted glycoside hydrolase/deacetylase ChbG (UPF0249 family)